MKPVETADVSSAAKIRIVRTVSFACAHRYFNPQLSEDENRLMYGDLYRVDGFGHNILVEVHFEGPVDPLTGMIVNLVDIDRWLKAAAVHFDHKTLNDLAPFQDQSPTPERLAQVFHDLVLKDVKQHSTELELASVRVYEGDDLWVDYGRLSDA